MAELQLRSHRLQLLAPKAIYVETLGALLVSDLHLGKAETFQHHGLAIPSQVNQTTLDRLTALCTEYQPHSLWILGDLFHSVESLSPGVIESWLKFLAQTQVSAHLILGNHDRRLQPRLQQLSLVCFVDAVETDGLLLSHEPLTQTDLPNLCGHVHPCLRLSRGCDRLRLPCFHWQAQQNRLTLPAFGAFTGGYDIQLAAGDVAYVVAEDGVVPFTA
ncbi:MAG TPA: ligase-associated DNA damage response endonuclease PdeM [Leptolyngbyaceae cyanobacterium M65_K2018_010]|nr:ligase-associated DNA damage response endonuclease PdeM [Leptolyngbyaceae cyanobacterium M65_K2018_010]